MTPEWRAALTAVAARTRELFDAGRRSATASAAGCAGSCAAPGSAARAFSIRLDGRGFDVFRAAADARAVGRPTRSCDRVASAAITWKPAGGDRGARHQLLLLVPGAAGEKRQAIIAVWDFCRAVDDAVDEAPARTRRRAAQGSRAGGEELARLLRRGHAARPRRAARCSRSSRASSCRAQPFDALIEGVEMDLDARRYETFADLYRYCMRVASAVGLICLEIFGYRDPASRQYATDLGVALQLTNILRDVPEISRGAGSTFRWRTFARFGCTEGDLRPRRSMRATASGRPRSRRCCAPGAARASTTTRAPRGAAARRRAPPGRRARSWARSIAAILRPHRAARLRRVHRGRPRSPAAPRADRRRDLGADRRLLRSVEHGRTSTSSSSAPGSPG